jgi:pyridoxal phosphate enzyme (YggS family)
MTDAEIRERLRERLQAVEERIVAACRRAGRESAEVTLVAVTKAVGARVARLLPEMGVLDLGESRPQELWRKVEALPGLGIRWHFIGHLQRNKIEPTLRFIHLLHSIDSRRLLTAIETYDPALVTHALLEVNASREQNKHGFAPAEVPAVLASLANCPHVRVEGLMVMAAYADDPEQSRPAFQEVRRLRDAGKLPLLSMGMSNDFEIAIEEGATHVRLGTVLFAGLDERETASQ